MPGCKVREVMRNEAYFSSAGVAHRSRRVFSTDWQKKKPEQTISRVLFPARRRGNDHSSGTPVARCLMQPTRKRKSGQLSEQPEGVRASLFGLAPDGVYQATPVTRDTGELLPHLFTLTLNRLAPAQGGLFSAALSLGSPPVAVSDHPALRSPDFPPQPD